MTDETAPLRHPLDLPVGAIVPLGTGRVRHLGGGRFEAVAAEPELFCKRFDPGESGPFLGRAPCS